MKSAKINLINGDCLVEMKKMADKSIDVCFTSPPYNRKRNDKYSNYNDAKINYFSFLAESIMDMRRIIKGNIFLNIQKTYYNKVEVFQILGYFAKEICEVFIWEKSNPMPASGKAITNAYEFIICFGDKVESNNTYTKNHITTSVAKMPENHKAVMNPAVADFFIKNFTHSGDLILDPFMGTGTTGKICKGLDRSFIGIEIAEEYFQMAKKRIEDNTDDILFYEGMKK